MSVSNIKDGESVEIINKRLRLGWQARAVGNGSTTVLLGEIMPIQYITPAGAATIRLDLAARDGEVTVVVNVGAGGALTVTDNAGSPNTIATLATNTSGIFHKRGASGAGVYSCVAESAAIA